jgi:hypothetical protein
MSDVRKMTDEIFADRMVEISQVGSTVRIDLQSLSATERQEDGTPKLVFRQRVVMPLDGFLQSFQTMERMVAKLVEAGVLVRRPGPGDASGDEGESSLEASPPSPNFPN